MPFQTTVEMADEKLIMRESLVSLELDVVVVPVLDAVSTPGTTKPKAYDWLPKTSEARAAGSWRISQII